MDWAVFLVAAVAVLAIVERRTGFNVFDRLGWIPLIEFEGAQEQLARGGRLRVYASAQHPIALAALFMMIVPLAMYLAEYTKRFVWYAASIVLALGALATISRTTVVMATVMGVMAFLLRRRLRRRRSGPRDTDQARADPLIRRHQRTAALEERRVRKCGGRQVARAGCGEWQGTLDVLLQRTGAIHVLGIPHHSDDRRRFRLHRRTNGRVARDQHQDTQARIALLTAQLQALEEEGRRAGAHRL